MTNKEHLHFIQFIEERRSMASSPQTKSAYTIVKDQYIKIHSKNLEIIDMNFKLLKDIPAKREEENVIKAGKIFRCYNGLISGVRGIKFTDKNYFEAVNIKYKIK
jgi:hypothetical protein